MTHESPLAREFNVCAYRGAACIIGLATQRGKSNEQHSLARVLCASRSSCLPVHRRRAESHSRKDVLKLAARVADWQLERMGATHGVTSTPKKPESAQLAARRVLGGHDATRRRHRREAFRRGHPRAWAAPTNGSPGKRTYHADDHVIAQSYLWAAQHGAGTEAIAPLRATFDSILAKPPIDAPELRHRQGLRVDTACLRRWCWCDALFMSPPAWLELSRQTGDPRYADFAMAEFWATTDFLYDPAEKLYFRDSRFFERRDDKGRKQFWSRGNGWVFAGIANMLDALPKDNPASAAHRTAVSRDGGEAEGRPEARRLLGAVVVGPENSPPETSGTGFYVYGLAWGVKHRIAGCRATIGPAIDKGWAALTRAVAKDGRLGWVQQVSDRPENVAEADTQYYGVGAFLLAASAIAER